jgi:hypothetical protein
MTLPWRCHLMKVSGLTISSAELQLCLSIAKSPNLQKTLDFPAGSQYSRRGNEWFNCLHLGILFRLQSAS